ncbi:MAG: Uncharacterised protein [Opitutia bacterium UBA7350]|nr:MAG: Uncharacterised protein [Opitutae bacterium UBA7350]
MSLLERRRQRPSINIVPLVDVLTVLLFFFLVTMQFREVTALNITAPEIETAGKNNIDENVIIVVDKKGVFYLNDQQLHAATLDTALRVAGEVTPDIPVLLMADEDAPLKYVTEVMDLCRKNRLNKIRLQAR